ncbi:type II secretion system secretin GspD [Sedimentisphaera salicampi]|uniref:General secretion pathway protein D n=1 Tax=Sedimentisphaera salicampi TaxID=1941349 RepID=A0A1W6LP71_9BACT|nr:type II secretion system secretin GspD [Sedimentisphaera salicampi]ARN57551.1 Putative general secretion pathway protein D [Sedimentisphaera salicampi]OXU14413.1 putative general secretion pathway protein D [Sedimentisphaera salicampi]
MKIDKKLYIIAAALISACFCMAQAAEDKPAKFSEDVEIKLNFQDVPVADVLDYLSQEAGFVVVSDVVLTDRVTVVSKQPLDADEVVSLINSVLVDMDYAAVRVGRTLKILDISRAKYSSIPVSSGSELEDVPETDEVITHIIPIKYADAVKVKDDIASLISEQADFTSNEASNSIIITDTASNIRRIVKIIQALDTRMASIASVKVFNLVYAEADNTADLINEVFEQDTQEEGRRGRNPFERMMRSRMGDRDDNGSSGAGVISQNIKVRAAADEDTNTVVVSGPSDTLEIVAEVVEKIDKNPAEERSFFVYKLKNAEAANLKDVLNNLFEKMEDFNEDDRESSGRRGNIRRGGSGSSETDLSEEVYMEAEEDTNSLIIMTSQENYDKIKPIIDELDEPVPQVLIKVLIAEVARNDDFELGTEFSVLSGKGFVDTDGDGTADSLQADSELYGTEFLPSDLGDGGAVKILEGDLEFAFKALSSIGEMNVLSRPYILTSNNQTATINVGKEVPFITDTRTTETGQTINTIQYEDIGIILEVTPVINDEGLVTMDIAPEISNTTTETVPISETVDATVFSKRSSESRVAIQDGQTIVIGGLMQDDDKEVNKKVPLLGDIPILGELFKSRDIQKQKTELLIFLTPHVADRNENLMKISENEKTNSESISEIDSNPALKKHIENMQSQPKQ